ncbi:mechanosensitive ion channel family protein [Herbidospora mongoliensis]|uniref:mechanosensitive ion channel family protein n=1 Tax=Herbidospora mongoliensis TaxID=688067 RepID=UPI00082E4521|nr:mechanosensitive ion channel family protein [Herbidospora mongoliensis]
MFLLSPSPIPTPTPSPTPPGLIPDAKEAASALCSTDDFGLCNLMSSLISNGDWAKIIAGLLSATIAVVLILVVALILRAIVHRLIKRVSNRASSVSMPERLRSRFGGPQEGLDAILAERRRQRSETLGSVLRHVTSIVILGTALLMVISRLGLDLAPLLTSVGILGVAIGFGAQELVKDFIAGMFMLMEDQYGVGDVIDVAVATGTVEAVSLRITRVRDADGKVWYVRNGTITRVGNESQGWSRALVDVPVAYDSDVAQTRELLVGVTSEMWEHQDYRDIIIVEEPQVFGMEQISGTAIVFRVVAKTAPGKQHEVARELRTRIKRAFDERGLAIATIA